MDALTLLYGIWIPIEASNPDRADRFGLVFQIVANTSGRPVQDVRIDGIPIENARAAIKMIKARQKRVL
jgi:hypothetical protein